MSIYYYNGVEWRPIDNNAQDTAPPSVPTSLDASNPTLSTINLSWTAPASGTVTFYYGGNAINDNGNTNGDNASMGSMSIDANPNSLSELEKTVALDIFPNPVSDIMNLRTNALTSDTYDLQLIDQNGKQISNKKIMVPSGKNAFPIEVTNLPTGIYNLILSDGKNQITKKMLKM